MNDTPPPTSDPDRNTRAREHVIRRLMRAALLVFAILAVALTAVIETPVGVRALARFALSVARPFPGLEAEVSGARGGMLTGLELHGIRLRDARGATALSVDTLRVSYRLNELLTRPLVLRHLGLIGMTVDTRGLPRVERKPAREPLALWIRRLDLDRVALLAALPGTPRDSLFAVRDLFVRVSELRLGRAPTATLDSLHAVASVAGIAQVGGWPIRAMLSARGALLTDRARIDGLRIRTEASDITLVGVVPIPGDSTLAALDVTLTAAPLGGRDLNHVVAGADHPGDLTLRAFARSDGARATFGLEARGPGEGRVRLDGSIDTPPGGAIASHVRGTARHFDLADVLGGPRGTRVIEATLRADLAGSSLDRLDGPVAVSLAGTRFGDVRIDDAALDARFNAGRAALTVRLRSGAWSASTSGWARPFDSTATGEMNARLDLPPIHTGDDASPLVYRGGARLALAFSGVSDTSRTGSLRVTLDPEPGGPMLLSGGDGRLAWHANRLNARAGITFADGSIETEAEGTLGRELAYRVSKLRMRGVRAALPGWSDTIATQLDADLALEGRGVEPATLRLDARATSFELRHGALTLARGDAHGAIDRGSLVLDAVASLDTGSVSLHATVAFPTRGTAIPPAALTGRAQLTLKDARAFRRVLKRGEASVDLAHGVARLEGLLETDAGRATWRGSAHPFDATPAFELDRLSFSGVDLGAWTAHPQWSTRLDGHIEANARGSEAGHLDAEAHWDLAGSRVLRATFDRLDGRLRLTGRDWDGMLDGRSNLGSASITARGTLDPDSMRVASHGRLELPQLGALLGRDSLAGGAVADFDLAGAIPATFALDGADLRLGVEGNARLGRVRLDTLRVAGHLHDAMLSIARLELTGEPISVRGSGTLPLYRAGAERVGEFRLDLEGDHLELLGPALGVPSLSSGPVLAHLEAYGSSGSRDVKLSVSALRGSVAAGSVDTIGVSAEMRLEEERITHADARVVAGNVMLGAMVPRELSGSLAWDGDTLRVDARSQVGPTRYLDIGGTVWPAERRALLERFELRQLGAPVSLAHPVPIAYSNGVRVQDLMLIKDGAPMVRLDGGFDSRGRIDARGSIEHFRIDDLMQLVGLPTLGGTLDANIEAGGTFDGLDARGELDLSLEADRKPLLRAQGHGRWTGDRVVADFDISEYKAGTMTISAGLPLTMTPPDSAGVRHVALGAGPLDTKLAFQRFDLAPFNRIISPRVARKLSGRFDGELHLGGTIEAPVGSGSVTLDDGGVELPRLGTRFKQGSAHLALDGTSAVLERFTLRSGAGRLDASGKLRVQRAQPVTLEFETRLDRFRLLDSAAGRVAASGQVACAGTLAAPRVSGDLTLEDGVVWLAGATTGKYETVELTEADRRELRTRFDLGLEGATRLSDRPDPVTLDVGIRIGRGMWLRSRSDPVLALELKGDFRTGKSPGQPLRIAGNAGVIPGRSSVNFLGRRFEVTDAKVDLPGKVEDARATVEARYDASAMRGSRADVEVTAFVTADANGAVIDLRSRPHLERDEILKFITTGQVPGGTATGSEDVAGLAAGWVIGTVGGAAGQRIGIDVVQVSQDAYGGLTMSAGTYVHPRVYLGIREPINSQQTAPRGPGNTTITTEYDIGLEALTRLLVEIQGNDQQTRIFFRPRLGR